jgi:hypothetical protein
MQDESSSILASPGFVAALLLLLLNDFFLKPFLHNSFTGKLSDFAGLFLFPLFWVSFFPRFRLWIYLTTAGLFILWKSAASTILINSWNSLNLFPIDRTVDYGDLISLAILPVSYVYGLRRVGLRMSRAWPAAIALVSVFAFAATSFSHKTSYQKDYYFAMPKHELLQRMSSVAQKDVNDLFWKGDEFSVSIESCIEADFSVKEENRQTVLTLKETNYECPRPPSKEEMLKTFEQEFIAKLSENPTIKSPRIRYLVGFPKFSNPSPSASQPVPPKPANRRTANTR